MGLLSGMIPAAGGGSRVARAGGSLGIPSNNGALVSLSAPDALAAAYGFTFPDALPAASRLLTVSSAGVLSYTDPAQDFQDRLESTLVAGSGITMAADNQNRSLTIGFDSATLNPYARYDAAGTFTAGQTVTPESAATALRLNQISGSVGQIIKVAGTSNPFEVHPAASSTPVFSVGPSGRWAVEGQGGGSQYWRLATTAYPASTGTVLEFSDVTGLNPRGIYVNNSGHFAIGRPGATDPHLRILASNSEAGFYGNIDIGSNALKGGSAIGTTDWRLYRLTTNTASIDGGDTATAAHLRSTGRFDLMGTTSGNTAVTFAPSFAAPGASSTGMKLQLLTAGTRGTMAAADYAIGVGPSQVWYNSAADHRFYSTSVEQLRIPSGGGVDLSTRPLLGGSAFGTNTVRQYQGASGRWDIDGGSGVAGAVRVLNGSDYVELGHSGGVPVLTFFDSGASSPTLSPRASAPLGITCSNGFTANGAILSLTSGLGSGPNIVTPPMGSLSLDGGSGGASFVRWREQGLAERGTMGFAAGSADWQLRLGATSMTDGTERLRVAGADGRLTHTATPSTGIGARLSATFLDPTTAAAGVGAGIVLGGAYTGTTTTSFATVEGLKVNGTAGDYAGRLRLSARANGGNLIEALRAEASGTTPSIGFLGASAVARQTVGAEATGGATIDAEARTSLAAIRTALINLGLCAA